VLFYFALEQHSVVCMSTFKILIVKVDMTLKSYVSVDILAGLVA